MKKILLSFDIEEFDTPLEYGKSMSMDRQIEISAEGTKIILDLLLEKEITATFFSTVVFASHATDLIQRIYKEGHELASHGYYHSKFQNEHLLESKTELERISGDKVVGFRMARMMPVNNEEIQKAGYIYNSSLNPIYLPGRYNNLMKPRTLFKSNSVTQVPASATPIVRFPLFWLSFHNFPLWFYKSACLITIHSDAYLSLYFHPWEFTDLTDSSYGLPSFVSKNSGPKMINRFSELLLWMKRRNYAFSTIRDFVTSRKAST